MNEFDPKEKLNANCVVSQNTFVEIVHVVCAKDGAVVVRKLQLH